MCEEELSSTLKRVSEEDIVTNLQRDLATVVRQAQRIAGLLEKMRVAASERMKQVEAEVTQAGIPSSPEAFGESITENL